VDTLGLASLEYAAAHLGVPLVVVMGHSRCGAVEATVKGGEASGNLSALLSAIAPSVEAARGHAGELVEEAARENVRSAVAALEARETVLGALVAAGRLRVVGAFYDVYWGTVDFFV
ncbi:MAG TPA: carbonic anhydrase, partial [Candidatus Bathyarchaeia archaeon]|nr:carbonic anhydrase [Candidatus Bathyarchaeia archaeon]